MWHHISPNVILTSVFSFLYVLRLVEQFAGCVYIVQKNEVNSWDCCSSETKRRTGRRYVVKRWDGGVAAHATKVCCGAKQHCIVIRRLPLQKSWEDRHLISPLAWISVDTSTKNRNIRKSTRGQRNTVDKLIDVPCYLFYMTSWSSVNSQPVFQAGGVGVLSVHRPCGALRCSCVQSVRLVSLGLDGVGLVSE